MKGNYCLMQDKYIVKREKGKHLTEVERAKIEVYLKEKKTKRYIAASNRDQYSVEDEITGHGVFTELLIKGLLGGAADVGGNITPASLYSFVD